MLKSPVRMLSYHWKDKGLMSCLEYTCVYIFSFVVLFVYVALFKLIGTPKDVCVMAREDEVENEQEVAKPTEAEAANDDEYVEEIIEDEVEDGKASILQIVLCTCKQLSSLKLPFCACKYYGFRDVSWFSNLGA